MMSRWTWVSSSSLNRPSWPGATVPRLVCPPCVQNVAISRPSLHEQVERRRVSGDTPQRKQCGVAHGREDRPWEGKVEDCPLHQNSVSCLPSHIPSGYLNYFCDFNCCLHSGTHLWDVNLTPIIRIQWNRNFKAPKDTVQLKGVFQKEAGCCLGSLLKTMVKTTFWNDSRGFWSSAEMGKLTVG